MTPTRHPGRGANLILDDIVAWADRLARHLDGVSWERFAGDTLIEDAVTRCIEIVGEASGRLLAEPPDPRLEALRPVLRKAYLTRNQLAHGYAEIDQRLLWETATVHVAALAAAVREVRGRR
jgi:uncharacterized protein with HEPN domain